MPPIRAGRTTRAAKDGSARALALAQPPGMNGHDRPFDKVASRDANEARTARGTNGRDTATLKTRDLSQPG
jgi:hypothetical protein